MGLLSFLAALGHYQSFEAAFNLPGTKRTLWNVIRLMNCIFESFQYIKNLEFICRHTHELIDKNFSRILIALAKMLEITFSDLAKIKHNVLNLTITFNVYS